MPQRVILHCDCNSFFASVETVLNPKYADVPMAVCGSSEDRHGIVLAKNELAKKYGIKTAETVYSAKKKCKSLVIASPHYDEYVKYSHAVNEIYKKYTDMVEPFGIDESWLDVTASEKLFGTGEQIAELIRNEVKSTLGITVSIGVSFNKVFAKLGSDYKKPDAITVISKKNYKNIVFPLPAEDLLFVGKKTADTLHSLGIFTIGDLAGADDSLISSTLGKFGRMILDYARGEDASPVEKRKEDAKSVSNGFTFRHDITTYEECKVGIDYLAEEIGYRLRKNGQVCSTVSLTLKNEHLHSIQRQRPQDPPTDISREIAATAYKILLDSFTEGKSIRMITVTASNLSKRKEVAEQITFFEDEKKINKRERSEKRENALDDIRQRFGNDAIISGALIDTDLGIYGKEKKQ